MICSINFKDMAGKINAFTFVKHLQETGWIQYPIKRNDIKIFQFQINHELEQITLPMQRDLRDYNQAMYDAVKILAHVEQKKVAQIILCLLINKRKVKMNKLKIIAVALGAALCIYAAYHLLAIADTYNTGKEIYNNIKEQAVVDIPNRKTDTSQGQSVINFTELKAVNQDIIAWICFDNIDISYPIVQTDNNLEYLTKTADKSENSAGSIFMDMLCGADFNDTHTIIYGHNMKDHSMFGQLKNFKSDKKFINDNQYFTIYTPEKTLRYEIFSFYDTNETDKIFKVPWEEWEITGLIGDMIEKSYVKSNLAVESTDKIITLSTCSSEGKRFVVNAKECDR